MKLLQSCHDVFGFGSIRQITGVATFVTLLFPVSSIAPAQSVGEALNESLLNLRECESASPSRSEQCLVNNSLNVVLNMGMHLANAHGKKTFGEHFQVVGDLGFSADTNKSGLQGNLDIVIPFASDTEFDNQLARTAFFFQQGITRWRDDSGLLRNDFRHGVVRRFRVSSDPGADIVGLSALHLFNIENRHEVLVPGIDYTGRWGTGSLRYYIPTTGWHQVRPGREERALEGMEIGARFDLSTTLNLNATGYKWGAEDGSANWNTGARLDLDWRPHPWLKFSVGHDGFGGSNTSSSIQFGVSIPLGGPPRPTPRWDGLGIAASGSKPTKLDLWQPIENVGQIRVATRSTASVSVSDLVNSAEVRFLQETVESGGSIRLEVLLPTAAPEDIRVAVRLVPGEGDNPAVPGVDFVDEPVETIIHSGTRSNTVSIQLLRNDNMQANRSLDATVELVS